ncbi:Uncharacterized protein FWK35_00026037 [Aphis craccivora]|uniref:Uncharacterized protein n=1 Tax=Aphis craccivora TaxID=307492 RepID=A0A6G0Y3U0_APHCR|nr:Uncharacterized protein FWK35_00026037 [Aphis craccivora]
MKRTQRHLWPFNRATRFSTITSRNNAPISNFGGSFQCKSEYPWCIIEVNNFQQFSKKSRKTKKKITEKRKFLRKTGFRPNQFFYIVMTKNVYTSNFYEICRKRENLQRNDNDLSSNDFKYFLCGRYLKNLPFPISTSPASPRNSSCKTQQALCCIEAINICVI